MGILFRPGCDLVEGIPHVLDGGPLGLGSHCRATVLRGTEQGAQWLMDASIAAVSFDRLPQPLARQ